MRAAIVIAPFVLAAGVANAEPWVPSTPTFAPQPEPAEVVGYQDQILIASGVGIATYLAAAASAGPDGEQTPAYDVLFATGTLVSFAAPPIVHFAHGEYRRGARSFALRVGLATVGGLVAMSMDSCEPDEQKENWFCEMDAVGPGALLGVTIASLVDAAMTTPSEGPARPARVQPILRASSNGGQVGLAGSF
jgi:hypothetical protein